MSIRLVTITSKTPTVAPRNSGPIHFTSQLLAEERLLALEDKRDQVHDGLQNLIIKRLTLCL